MFDKGFFGGLFDFNGDGNLDSFEKAADFSAFMHMVSESEEPKESNATSSSITVNCSSISCSSELEDALDDAGIDIFDFEMMDADEQASVLEEAGYDINDFD